MSSLESAKRVRAVQSSQRLLVSIFCVIASFALAQAAEPNFTLPPGFTIERVAGAPEIRFPMFACLDERRRLFVAESSGLDLYAELQKLTRKCRISLLEDRDGDGRFERAQVFADQLVFPMGLVWRAGKLFVADPPDLITLEDTDGDGRADRRTVLLTGFGHTDNGSLHGLTFGPDGWLYLTMGQPDGYKLRRADRTHVEGRSGALLRCRADGSDIEMICRGFENLVEVEFMPAGEIIGTDNWFFLPAAGVRDALVHLVEGGVYPLNAHAKTEAGLFSSGELLPPLAVYPAVALSGLVRYRGDAFPQSMHGSLFSAQFNTRKVVRHQLTRLGSTFQSTDEDFVSTEDPDFHPSDVLEDADGSLVVVDTGSWYVHHCPTGRIRKAPAEGGIFRVRFNHPGGTQKSRGSRREEALTNFGFTTDDLRLKAPSLLTSAATNGNSELLALAARTLGRHADKSAEPPLLPLLRHPAAHVRLAAAEALAHCGGTNTIAHAIEALARSPDRFEEHALVHVLHRRASLADLERALAHPHPRVQQAALVLLDQSPHNRLAVGEVLTRLSALDTALAGSARAALRKHPEWLGQALPLMRRLASSPGLAPPELETLREFVLAFRTDPAVAALVGEMAAASRTSNEARVLLLEAMAHDSSGPVPASWPGALANALGAPSPEVRFQAVRTLHTLRLAAFDDDLARLANDAASPGALRMEALRALARRPSGFGPAGFDFLLRQLERTNSVVARLGASEVISASALNESQLTRYLRAVSGDAMISPQSVLGLARRVGVPGESSTVLLEYLQAALPTGLQLTEEQLTWLATAVPAVHRERVGQLRQALNETLDRQRERLAELEPLLQGGDPNRGHQLFLEKSGCAACHRVGQRGGLAGPDLTKIGAIRSGRDLIESIVLPSATLAQGYDSYSVTLKNGDELTGIRARQADDALVLRDASGAETRLRPEQIESMVRLKLSLMPEGLLAALTREEIRDLLAYLQNLK